AGAGQPGATDHAVSAALIANTQTSTEPAGSVFLFPEEGSHSGVANFLIINIYFLSAKTTKSILKRVKFLHSLSITLIRC
ncbi:hypothetical protein RN053_01630, partial [Pantoea dispersa]|uniref:hypothetical protein n=1 Tax=Pantoea dispersa TaxID=59814 RepID=UPI0028DDD2B1